MVRGEPGPRPCRGSGLDERTAARGRTPRRRETIRGLVHNGDPVNRTDLTRAAAAALRGRAQDGDAHAAAILDGLVEDGMRSHVEVVMREETCSIALSGGRSVDIPIRLAIRPTDESGNKERWVTRPFWEWTWAEFAEGLAHRIAMRDRSVAEVEGLQEVAKLRDLYPDSLTPGEACEMAGTDRRSFAVPS